MNTKQAALLKKSFVHPARTTLAAALALIAAHVLGLHEVYWAPISTLIIMQSTLGASLTISWQRFLGTILGSALGALLVTFFGSSLAAYSVGVFVLGLLCAALKLENAYRFAGITLTVIMLIAHSEPAWVMAAHRCVEVSLGIVVGVIVSALWPELGASHSE
jgi:uncharacterized membrane protein YgaE (UPF0421/DUF939 family)